jgi:hypothetical protein
MIEITATGDVTLHTAGKYCAEDILVRVPASSGGGSVDTCTVTIDASVRPSSVLYQQQLGEYTLWKAEGPLDYPPPIECIVGTFLLINCATVYSWILDNTVHIPDLKDQLFLLPMESGASATISCTR